MSFAAGAFSGGARGAGGQSGGGPSRKVPTSTQQDAKDKRDKGLQGIEENNENANTNTPRATASLMFHALTSGLGVLGKEGPDKK